ncbi:MAG TPA: TonB-dependent receptor [Pyrinomonadaceae bacterium]|nr:TonB-dependent receptor [Pyrinomonadaceae bacterium]
MLSHRFSVDRVLSSLFILVLLPTLGEGQSRDVFKTASLINSLPASATLAGTVVDENDAVVPEARVLVKDVGTQIRKEVKTNQIGLFRVTELPPGSYIVAVQHLGFATAEIRGLPIKVNDQLALKIQLKVGQIGETVTIDADSSIVQRSPAISTNLNRQIIENLPLNGQSLQPVIALTPGVVITKPTFAEQGQFSVNGQRANTNYFMVDGVSANIGVAAGADGLGQSGAGSLPGLTALGTTHSLFSIEALQEFKILTSTYAPEFGRMPGAQVVVQTRSGGNEFRTNLFEYFRNGTLSANDWFANQAALPKPELSHHDFGGTFSGPVIKGKTFFFLSYEALRLRLPQVASVDVPSMAARDSAPALLRPFMNAFPLPNAQETANGLARFAAGYTDTAFSHATSIRVDQQLGEKLSIFGRFSYAPSETETRGGAGTSLNTTMQMAFATQTFTIGATHLLSPKISNDLRMNYSATKAGKYFNVDDLGGAEVPADSMLFPPLSSEADSLYTFSLGGNAAFSVGKDATNFQHQLNLVDNLASFTGSHQLKFGIDYRRLTPVYGRWKYKQFASFNGVAELLTGTASSVAIQAQDEVGMVFTNLSAYAQDAWKASWRLTLTYGLRWEFNPPPKGRDDQPLYTVQGLDNPQTLSLAPVGTPYYSSTYSNFAPRVGAAFQLSDHQGWERILRGGFGIFYDMGTGSLANASVSFPYMRRKVLSNVAYPLDPVSAEPLALSLNPPVGRIRATDPHLRLPLTMQWNLTLEQSLGSKRSFLASYVGAVGHRLLRLELLNNPNANFGQVFITTNGASSSYHALQLQFQRRLSHSLQSHVAYTLSHSIDNASNDSFVNPSSAFIPSQVDRAASDFDVRHTFAGAITYSIPTPPFGKQLFRNWSVDGIITARSAAPVDVFFRRDLGFGPFNFRPDVVPDVPLYLIDGSLPGGRAINRAAFVIPQMPRQGTLSRNSLRGFPIAQTDLALRRRFALTERINLQFGANVFNLFNRPNFADPIGDLNSSLFGLSTAMFGKSLGTNVGSVGLNSLYQTGGPRSIQMSLKLQF